MKVPLLDFFKKNVVVFSKSRIKLNPGQKVF